MWSTVPAGVPGGVELGRAASHPTQRTPRLAQGRLPPFYDPPRQTLPGVGRLVTQ